LRTPPRALVLAQPEDDRALGALATAIDDDVREVVGAVPEVHAFAEAWCARAGCTSETVTGQGIYSLTTVKPPTGVPGEPRVAMTADLPLLVAWWRAFVSEALDEDDPEAAAVEQHIEQRLAADGWGFVLWQDGGTPVSFAGFGGATPN